MNNNIFSFAFHSELVIGNCKVANTKEGNIRREIIFDREIFICIDYAFQSGNRDIATDALTKALE